MKVTLLKNRIFLSVTFYVMIVTIIVTIIYYRHREHIYMEVDQRIGGLAATVQYVLADDFHDRALLKESIAPEEDLQNIKLLTHLARQSGITYLYSAIIRNGQIFITASSASEEEIASKSEVRYFTSYNEAVHLIVDEHRKEKPKFVTYTDRWGTFRAGILPRESPSGRLYIAAAEVNVSSINKGLQNELLISLGYSFLLLAASVPLYLVFSSRLRSDADSLRYTNERLVLEKKTRIRLEEGLIQAQKMELVGRLAGGVAHDFNNMLAVILGHAEMAMDELNNDHPLFHNLREIYTAAQRSADITRQLLAFARKQTIVPKVIDLNPSVEGMLKMLQRLIGENVALTWKPGYDLWAVKIDSSQLDQILTNLCVNGRDAISDVGTITMETSNFVFDEEYCQRELYSMAGDYVMLAVSDTGCGMDSATMEHIFEPFFTTKDIGKGTGLGLATVYGIVKQNNGFINAYSEPGRGTTFKIYLPRHISNMAQYKTDNVSIHVTGGHETILLVEDEPTMMNMTSTMLQRLGYSVVVAGTPGEAMQLVEDFGGKIQLLITDLIMPEMNGKDLSEKLLIKQPEMQVLFMSGYTANVIAHHGVLDEGVQFIQKPFSKIDLAAKIRMMLD